MLTKREIYQLAKEAGTSPNLYMDWFSYIEFMTASLQALLPESNVICKDNEITFMDYMICINVFNGTYLQLEVTKLSVELVLMRLPKNPTNKDLNSLVAILVHIINLNIS